MKKASFSPRDGLKSTMVKGTVYSTNNPFTFSDSDVDYCSSPCLSSPPDSPSFDKALALHPSDSFPNLGDFFESTEVFDLLILPLQIDRSYGNPCSDREEEVMAITEGYSSPGDLEDGQRTALTIGTELSDEHQDDPFTEESPKVDLENPATIIPILISWLSKMGLCISVIPIVKKLTAAKKKKKSSRELMNLCTDMQFQTKASSSRRLGSSYTGTADST